MASACRGTRRTAGLGGEEGDPNGTFCSAKPERAGQTRRGRHGRRDRTRTADRAAVQRRRRAEPDRIVITVDEFRSSWTAPQIRTVTPFQAEVGDVVTIVGANYTPRPRSSASAASSSATTFRSDTTLLATCRRSPAGGTRCSSRSPVDETSNPASVEVLPSLFAATPNPASLGMQVTFTGSGFDPGCRCTSAASELSPTRSAPTAPWSGDAPRRDATGAVRGLRRRRSGVRAQPGTVSPRFDRPAAASRAEHRFRRGRNSYSFLNLKASIAGVADARHVRRDLRAGRRHARLAPPPRSDEGLLRLLPRVLQRDQSRATPADSR